jgi:hypothetical protein
MNRYALSTAIAAAVLVSGCGSSDDSKKTSAAAPATSTASATPPPQDLVGTYKRFVSKSDINRTQKNRSELGPRQTKPKPEGALLFVEQSGLTVRNPDASFVVHEDYAATTDGKLSIRGYKHPEEGAFCGPEIPQNASYTWEKSGDDLVLRAVSDPCADRDSTLTGTWTKK